MEGDENNTDKNDSLLLGDLWKGILVPLLNMFKGSSAKSEQEKTEEPPLTERQIQLIRQSWKAVANHKQEAGLKMFGRLFVIAPYLKDLFPFGYDPDGPDLRKHALGVMETVETAVEGLDDLDELAPKLVELGRHHKQFELTDKEFENVGAALLWMLESAIGDEFTGDVKEAWADAFGLIHQTMKEGFK